MSELSQREIDGGISRGAIDAIRGNGKANGIQGELFAYRAKFMCIRVAHGVAGESEILLEPQSQNRYQGHGPKPVIAASRISLVISPETENFSQVKFEPGKSYFLHFSEAEELAGFVAPPAASSPRKGARR